MQKKNFAKNFKKNESSSFSGTKIYKYPTKGKDSGIKLNYKTGEFKIADIATGRINRRGCIIDLNISGISPENEYLMKQRFAGQDYRTAASHIVIWYNNYKEDVI